MLEWPRRFMVGFIKVYRLMLSPWLGNACRFEPTCSVYAIEAMERHGAAVGTYLMLHRLVRCNPWCQGGCDPVPKQTLFSRLISNSSEKKPS